MFKSPLCFFKRSVLQYLRQLKLFLTINHDHRKMLLIVSIVIARPQHVDMKYWMVVFRYFQLVVPANGIQDEEISLLAEPQ